MTAAQGKPSELNPLKVCRDLGLTIPGGMSDLSWARVLDLAVAAYWEKRAARPVETVRGVA